MIQFQRKSCNMAESDASKVPLSPELDNFLTQSRNSQTEYSQSDICQNKITFQFHQHELIHQFLNSAMFFDKSSEMTEVDKKDVKQIADCIAKRIILVSRKYHHEVHFDVIWVYYFVYQEKKDKWLPVFKIYKSSNSDEALYLDAFLDVHETWDHLIDNIELGESLLCVPRNGTYHFNGNLLNLEFVLAKDLRKKSHCNSALLLGEQNFQPFLWNDIKKWIKKILSKFSSLKERIINSGLLNKTNLMAVILTLVEILIGLPINIGLPVWEYKAFIIEACSFINKLICLVIIVPEFCTFMKELKKEIENVLNSRSSLDDWKNIFIKIDCLRQKYLELTNEQKGYLNPTQLKAIKFL